MLSRIWSTSSSAKRETPSSSPSSCPQALKSPPYLTFDSRDKASFTTNLEYHSPIAHYVNCQYFIHDIFFRGHDSSIVLVGPGFPHSFRLLRNTTFYVDGEVAQVKVGPHSFHHYNAFLIAPGLDKKERVIVKAPQIGLSVNLMKTRPLPPSRLAVQTIYKEDEDLLPLWIAYHHKIGFDVFLLYNNYAEPKNITVQLTKLRKDVDRPINIIVWAWAYPYYQSMEMGNVNTGQVTAQNHALQRYKYDVEWMMLNDNDEYLVPRQMDSAPALLSTIPDKYAAVSIETVWFGCPPKNTRYTTENYIHALTLRNDLTEGRWFRQKCIIRTKLTNLVITHIVVDADGLLMYLDPEIAWFNHYRIITKVTSRGECRDSESVEDKRILTLWFP